MGLINVGCFLLLIHATAKFLIIATRGVVFDEISQLYETHACKEYLERWHELTRSGLYRRDRIPQLADVDSYLQSKLCDVTGPNCRRRSIWGCWCGVMAVR